MDVRIIARRTLREFWEKPAHAEAEPPLKAWFREVARSDWNSPAAVKAAYRGASIVGNGRVVFNMSYCQILWTEVSGGLFFNSIFEDDSFQNILHQFRTV